jgi:hypothetical protein
VEVAAVDAGGPDPDEDLALPRLGVGMLLDEHLALTDGRGAHGGRFYAGAEISTRMARWE